MSLDRLRPVTKRNLPGPALGMKHGVFDDAPGGVVRRFEPPEDIGDLPFGLDRDVASVSATHQA